MCAGGREVAGDGGRGGMRTAPVREDALEEVLAGFDAGHFHVVEFFPSEIDFFHLEGVDIFVGEGDDDPDDETGDEGENEIPRKDGDDEVFSTSKV